MDNGKQLSNYEDMKQISEILTNLEPQETSIFKITNPVQDIDPIKGAKPKIKMLSGDDDNDKIWIYDNGKLL